MALMDIPNLDNALHSMARALRPGGWFVFSITHPCFKTPATGEIIDHADQSVRRTVGRYFIEGYWDGPGLHRNSLPIGAYHRTLSTYVNALTDAGLVIDRMLEPPLDTPVWREVPCLLYVRGHRSMHQTDSLTPVHDRDRHRTSTAADTVRHARGGAGQF